MASPAEVANDLEAQAARLRKTGHDALQQSLIRGAKTIRELLEVREETLKAVQFARDMGEDFKYGTR